MDVDAEEAIDMTIDMTRYDARWSGRGKRRREEGEAGRKSEREGGGQSQLHNKSCKNRSYQMRKKFGASPNLVLF